MICHQLWSSAACPSVRETRCLPKLRDTDSNNVSRPTPSKNLNLSKPTGLAKSPENSRRISFLLTHQPTPTLSTQNCQAARHLCLTWIVVWARLRFQVWPIESPHTGGRRAITYQLREVLPISFTADFLFMMSFNPFWLPHRVWLRKVYTRSHLEHAKQWNGLSAFWPGELVLFLPDLSAHRWESVICKWAFGIGSFWMFIVLYCTVCCVLAEDLCASIVRSNRETTQYCPEELQTLRWKVFNREEIHAYQSKVSFSIVKYCGIATFATCFNVSIVLIWLSLSLVNGWDVATLCSEIDRCRSVCGGICEAYPRIPSALSEWSNRIA